MNNNYNFLISINTQWINKWNRDNPTILEDGYRANPGRRWLNGCFTPELFARAIQIGYAFAAHYKNKDGEYVDSLLETRKEQYFKGGWRSERNFVRQNWTAVDIDEGYASIDEISKIPFFQQYGAILYTSPSHTPEHPKARLVFRLEKTLTAIADVRALYTAMIYKFGGDKACHDAGRMFYGSEGCDIETYPTKVIPTGIVNRLVDEGKEIVKKQLTPKTSFNVIGNSTQGYVAGGRKHLPRDQNFTLADGTLVKFEDVPAVIKNYQNSYSRLRTIACYCPLQSHGEDKKPGAFLALVKDVGTAYFYCGKCAHDGKAWHIEHEKDNEKWKGMVKSVAKKDSGKCNERYLKEVPDIDGCMFIRSPKGTGKTTRLRDRVKAWKEQGLRILLLGHRVSLLQSMAHGLGLDFYKEPSRRRSAELIVGSDHYALCVNSLWRLEFPNKHYDVVILDESEQVLHHLTSDTIPFDKRAEVMRRFADFIAHAKKVYCLDADLSILSVDTIAECRSEVPTEWSYMINEWKPSGRIINVYEDRQDLLEDMYGNVGKCKIAIMTNSKKLVHDIEKVVKENYRRNLKTDLMEFNGTDGTVRCVAISRDNADTVETQDFIENINAKCENIDMLICSPTLGTGVDITAPFDKVYGIFEWVSGNTHFDIDQHLHRVRNPKEVNVWINPSTSDALTDGNEILRRLVQRNEWTNENIRLKESEMNRDEKLYLWLVCRVQAIRNESRNFLKANWLRQQREHGVKLKLIPRKEDEDDENERADHHMKKSKAFSEEKAEAFLEVLKNKMLSACEYDFYKNKKNLSLEIKEQLKAHEFHAFYGLDVSYYDVEFVKKDERGLRKDVRSYETYEAEWRVLEDIDVSDRLKEYAVSDRRQVTQKKRSYRHYALKALD